MAFDLHFGQYVFKHAVSPKPFIGRDLYDNHFHEGYELMYFIHGKANFYIEQNQYSLRPHCLLIAPPGAHHYLDILDDGSYYERMVIRFDSSDIPDVISEQLAGCQPVYDITNASISECFFRMDEHCKYIQGELLQELMKSSLTEILIYLSIIQESAVPAQSGNPMLDQIITYINQNLPSIHSLNDICIGTHMSKSTVSRLFSSYMLISVMSYVRTKKCIYAKSLIEQGSSSITACETAGFRDYSTFYRTYEKIFRHAPSKDHAMNRNH